MNNKSILKLPDRMVRQAHHDRCSPAIRPDLLKFSKVNAMLSFHSVRPEPVEGNEHLAIFHNGIKQALIFMLQGIRPLHKALLGPAFCRYPVPCTQFAINQLQDHNIFHACWNIGKRLLSCNPFYNKSDAN